MPSRRANSRPAAGLHVKIESSVPEPARFAAAYPLAIAPRPRHLCAMPGAHHILTYADDLSGGGVAALLGAANAPELAMGTDTRPSSTGGQTKSADAGPTLSSIV